MASLQRSRRRPFKLDCSYSKALKSTLFKNSLQKSHFLLSVKSECKRFLYEISLLRSHFSEEFVMKNRKAKIVFTTKLLLSSHSKPSEGLYHGWCTKKTAYSDLFGQSSFKLLLLPLSQSSGKCIFLLKTFALAPSKRSRFYFRLQKMVQQSNGKMQSRKEHYRKLKVPREVFGCVF